MYYFRHSTCFSSLYFQLTLHFKFPWLYENSNLITASEELKTSFYLKMKIYNRVIRHSVIICYFNIAIIVELLNKRKRSCYGSRILPPGNLLGQRKFRAIFFFFFLCKCLYVSTRYLVNHLKSGAQILPLKKI